MRVLRLIFLAVIINFYVCLNSSNAQWTLQTSGISSTLYSVYFVNNNLGFAVGESGIILKTTNGGNNWSVKVIAPLLNLYGVRFANASFGWVVGDSGRIMNTGDGGATWVIQPSGTDKTLRSVYFDTTDTGWIVGDSVILKTTNRGENWVSQIADTMNMFYSVFFINSGTGWITGNSTLKTTNGGTNWLVKVSSTNGRSVFFVNEFTGWVVGGIYRLDESVDGGETWFPGLFKNSLKRPPATYTCIYFINENTGWYTSSHSFGGRVMMTTDAGLSWNTDYPTTQDKNLYGVFSMSSGVGWAVGLNGTILKRDALTGSTIIGSEIPSSYSLSQNFPNPFNPTTKIKFDLKAGVRSQESEVKLIIYDITGRERATLVNEQLQPGTYEVKFDGSNLPSGIYFYQLRANDFIGTKKLVLLK